MSEPVHNPHDKFARETFSDPERARAFVAEFLPGDIVSHLDLPTLKVLRESYLSKELKEYFSDLVLEIGIKDKKREKTNIALLFEHKSSPDRNVLIQLGYYLFAHWFNQLRQRKKPRLIVPLIYYQGKQKWEVPPLHKLFKSYPGPLLEFVPQLNHLLVSLNEIPDQQIHDLRNRMLAAAMATQKLRFNPTNLVEDFERILKLFPLTETDKNFLEILVVYSFTVTDLTEKNIAESIKSVPQPIKEKIMTTYDRLIQKGKREGILEGILEGKSEIILALHDAGLDVSQIAGYANIGEKEVLKILEKNDRLK